LTVTATVPVEEGVNCTEQVEVVPVPEVSAQLD